MYVSVHPHGIIYHKSTSAHQILFLVSLISHICFYYAQAARAAELSEIKKLRYFEAAASLVCNVTTPHQECILNKG